MFFLISTAAFAQQVENIPALKQKQPYENIAMQSLASDSNGTYTVIWIKKEVKAHYHKNHTERIVVMEGTGQMLLGTQIVNVGPGDFVTIPKGMIHAVRVTSKDKPMKVLSIQFPQFDGTDRVMVEKSGW